MKNPRPPRWSPLLLVLTAACGDVDDVHDHDHDHNHGLITSVVLNFTDDDGEVWSFTWSDPEDDGSPVIDDIILPDGADDGDHAERGYTLDVEVWNDLEDPAEDVTGDIEEAADEHQLFFTGSGVEGPATGTNTAALIAHDYADSDAGGLPLGIVNTITTRSLGAGELNVTLRHMPPENDQAVKVAGLAEAVASGGFGAIGGDNDVEVTFNIEVE